MKGVRRGARAWGVVFGAFARAWGIVFGAFAGRKGRLQGRKGVGQCFWGVRKGKKRVYDCFCSRREIFCKFEFYVHIHYYF